MKPILIVRPEISGKDREKLSKEGYLVVIAERQDAVYQTDQPKISLDISVTYTNCYICGERIYMAKERMNVLRNNKKIFYCTQGHAQSYK